MRRKFIFYILIILLIHSLPAVNYSLAPFKGSFGVNLGSEIYNEEIVISNLDTAAGWISGTPTKGDGTYNNNCIVAMGEINGFSDSTDYYIRVTVNTDSDFNYVSMSNPSYQRPYTLTIIGKCSNEQKGGNPKLLGKYKLHSNGSNFAEFNFKDGEIGLNSNPVYNALWFDIILGLPVSDITSSGLLTLPSGEQITLGRVDDYASFVTITMEYGKGGEAPQIATMSIPFSGYYRADNTNNDPNATVSLHVDTNAKIAALDIKNDAKTEINIAKLRFSQTAIRSSSDGNYSDTIGDTKLKTVRLFVSASPDPFVQEPDGFRLLHADYNYNEPVNDYNSVPFSIFVRPSNSSEAVEFDGREYVIGNEIIYNSLVPDVHDTNIDFPRSEAKTFYAILEGDMSIYIDYDGYPMKPGLYQEEVYVHVVAED